MLQQPYSGESNLVNLDSCVQIKSLDAKIESASKKITQSHLGL